MLVVLSSAKSIERTHLDCLGNLISHLFIRRGCVRMRKSENNLSFSGLQCTDKLRVTNLLNLLEYRNERVCWNDGYTGMFDGLCYCSIGSISYEKLSKTNKLMDLQRSYKVIAYRLESITYNMHTIEWE